MNRRIQMALDGELPLSQLTPAEREELGVAQEAIARALAQVPEAGPTPDMAGAVMWRITHGPEAQRAHAPRGLRRLQALASLFEWFWQPQAIRLRPVTAVAALALVLAGGFGLELAAGRTAGPPAVAVQQLVQFRLGAQGVQQVALVGDFGGWTVRYPMEQVAPGVWSTAVPLDPGVYDYAYVVDGGTWVLDPLAPAVSDGFGGANSRVSVLPPDGRART